MKKISSMAVVAAAVLAFMTASCSGKDAKEQGQGQVLAEVDGIKITVEEFNQRLQQIPGMAHASLDQEGKKKMLDNLIIRELLVKEALKRGMDKNKEVADKLKDFQERVLLDEILEAEIKEKAMVTPEEIKTYYESNRDEMKENEQVHAAHILVKTKEEAEEILKKLKKGANFGTVAEEKSLDPGSKSRGGDLGFFPRGQMVPAFEEAAFKLKPGDLSEPVQSPFGFHIIKTLEKKGGQPLTLEAAQPMIQQKLMQEKQTKVFDSLVEGLKSKAKITIHEELLKTEAPVQEAVPNHPEAPAPSENQ